ncbi:MAG: hypothetical protein WCI55_11125 [Armatimonadota bacterium]
MNKTFLTIERESVDEDFDMVGAVKAQAQSDGWSQIIADCLLVLSDKSKMEYWHSAVKIIFWGTSQTPTFPIPKMAIVARLYWCLINIDSNVANELDDNLIWTIASNLKGVGYLSDWDPQKDPEVLSFLNDF